MDTKDGVFNPVENDEEKNKIINSVKFKEFKFIFKRAKLYDGTFSNNGFSAKKFNGAPYVYKTTKIKVYGTGILGFINRIIGAFEYEFIDAYVAENKKGEVLDSISKDFGEFHYKSIDNVLYEYPYIKLSYEESNEKKVYGYKFDTEFEYDVYCNYLYETIK